MCLYATLLLPIKKKHTHNHFYGRNGYDELCGLADGFGVIDGVVQTQVSVPVK